MNEIDVIEMKQVLKGVAELARGFYMDLIEQGFTDSEALRFTIVWMASAFGNPSHD